jgi:hypothetical protein
MTTRPRFLLLLLSIAFASASTIPAQWCNFGDDGFDQGCCTPANPILPPFPATTLQADWGILVGCTQQVAIPPVTVQLGAPQFVLCDYALVSVFAQFPGGEWISGTLMAKYARTWHEINPLGPGGQVWRFLVNGDLACQTIPGTGFCTTILPRCAALNAPFPTIVHFDGHIDYACNLVNPPGGFNVSFSLNHMQGCVTHAWWSQAPLTGVPGHVEASYHLVGPAPFIFGNVGVPQGPILSDSVRSSYLRFIPNFQYACLGEADVANLSGSAALTTQSNAGCSCAVVDQCTNLPILCPAPACYEYQTLSGNACCPAANTQTISSWPIFVQPLNVTGLVAQSIGSWATFGHPWNGRLTIYFGALNYQDLCNAANWSLNAVVGVGTSNTFGQPFNTTPYCSPPLPFATAFIDLQNCLLLNALPQLPAGYGSVSAADLVFSLTLL